MIIWIFCTKLEGVKLSSKREQKKQYFTEKILNAAYDVFNEYGYEKSTIGMIADSAQVGRGTAYLYFSSKADLYRTTMERTLKLDKLIQLFSHIEYLDQIDKTLEMLVKKYTDTIFSIDKNVLGEFIRASVSESFDSDSFAYKFLVEYDNQIVSNLVLLFDYYKERQHIDPNFNSKICSDIILKIFIDILATYVLVNDTDANEVFNHTISQVQFIIKPYIKESDQ